MNFSTPILIGITIAFACGFSYFAIKIFIAHCDFKAAYQYFKQNEYPRLEQRKLLGHRAMQKLFYQWMGGQYLGLFLNGYGLYFLLTKIFERLCQ